MRVSEKWRIAVYLILIIGFVQIAGALSRYSDYKIQKMAYRLEFSGVVDSISPHDQGGSVYSFYFKNDADLYEIYQPYIYSYYSAGGEKWMVFSRFLTEGDSIYKGAESDSIIVFRNGMRYGWRIHKPMDILF